MGCCVQKTHFLRFSQGFALHLPGILHQQNTKINIINDPEVSRLSVVIHYRAGSSTGAGSVHLGMGNPILGLMLYIAF